MTSVPLRLAEIAFSDLFLSSDPAETVLALNLEAGAPSAAQRKRPRAPAPIPDQLVPDAGRLLKEVQNRPLEIEGRSITLTLSIGVGQFADDPTPEHLIKRVDAALYEAKQQGRNAVVSAE